MPLGSSRGLRTTTALSPPSFEFERKNSMISFIVETRISSFSIKICRETCRVRHASTSHGPPRSEEHTSELQSLMRISYAVFCLNKKKKKTHIYHNMKTTHNITA